MNLLGKIFVVLILVFSLVFMGFAVMVYSMHKNWQVAAASLKTALDAEQAKSKDLTARLDKLKLDVTNEKQAKEAQLSQLQNEKAQLQKQYDQLVLEQATLKEGERQAVEVSKQAQEMLAAKLDENEKLRDEITKSYAERDKAFNDSVALSDKLNEAEAELVRLKSYNLQLTEQNAQAKLVLDRHALDINEPVDNIPPDLDGTVLASKDGLVELSLGADDGLRLGHQAYVFRNARFLGKVEVVDVKSDKSVAKVIPDYRQGPIQREDRVSTRLPK